MPLVMESRPSDGPMVRSSYHADRQAHAAGVEISGHTNTA